MSALKNQMITPNLNLLVQNLSNMISIPSVNPFDTNDTSKPTEEKMSNFFESCLLDLGLEPHSHLVSHGRRNVWGTLKGGGIGPTILLAGHLDTVGVEGYTDPFVPKIEGNKIYGRGACDMKGGLAAILETIRILIKEKISLKSDVIVAGVVDEEHAMDGSRYFGQHGPKADLAIVAEPTDLIICPRHKGQICFSMKTRGVSAHSSAPENGMNAIYDMALVIKELEKLAEDLAQRQIDPISGNPSLNIGVIRGGSHHSTVPNFCEIEIDRRTVFGENIKLVMSEFKEILEKIKRQNSNFSYEIGAPDLLVPPLKTSENSPLVKSMRNATRMVLGKASTLSTFPGSTDAPNFNCPAVIFGAGSLKQCHSLLEFIDIEDLSKAVRVYLHTILALDSFCA